MIVKDYYDCSLGLAMDLVGGKWKLKLLWHLRKGPLRFGEIKSKLSGISQKSLTLQLRELEEVNLIDRYAYAEVPPKVEYTLTEKGERILPILLDLYNWAHKYATDHSIEVKPKSDPSIDLKRLFS